MDPIHAVSRWLPGHMRRRLRRLVTGSSIGRSWVFRRYARRNRWGAAESVSGRGSTPAQTEQLRSQLPALFERHNIRSLLDAPCGDGNWFRHVDCQLDRYIGVEIVPWLVKELRERQRDNEQFLCLDVIQDPLPCADAVLTRDFLVHLSDEHLWEAVHNMQRSGARLLLATSFPGRPHQDIQTGRWRPVDLEAAPYNFGPPLDVLVEGCTERDGQYPEKSLCVWRLDEL